MDMVGVLAFALAAATACSWSRSCSSSLASTLFVFEEALGLSLRPNLIGATASDAVTAIWGWTVTTFGLPEAC